MVILLPRHKRAGTSIGEGFAGGFQGGMESANQEKMNRIQNEVEERKQSRIDQLKGEQAQKKHEYDLELLQEEYNLKGKIPPKGENKEGLNSALDTISRMRSISKKGNLGFGLGIRKLYNPEARRESGEYEQLGKSLIQYASNIPIRNKVEFETLAENLYDPSKTDDEREGILSAMERIIKSSMGKEGVSAPNSVESKPPLSTFRR